jgi:hypothetical protein
MLNSSRVARENADDEYSLADLMMHPGVSEAKQVLDNDFFLNQITH